jgi:hypothetical protein
MQHARGARPRARRRLGGYAPLAAGVAALVAVVAVTPSHSPDGLGASDPGHASEVPVGQPASGWGTTVSACPDGGKQDPAAAYAPPCFAFDGANGGATAPGVTADTVDVSYRLTAEGNVMALLAELSGLPIDEDTGDLERTAQGLIDYFNETFQLYGRHIELKSFQGRGQLLQETFGAGQDAAGNDAIRAAQELHSFADVTGLTQPYADALARNHVIGIGAPYMSREWFAQRRPYAWSSTPDCTSVGEAGSEYMNARLAGRKALFAGDALRGRTRRVAVIAPDNLEYQQCLATSLDAIEAAGNHVDLVLDYVLDLAQAQPQAASLLARLKDADVTTVACFCDPLLLLSLAGDATRQDWFPEWLVTGVGFLDLDLVGRFIAATAPGQWDHAFGLSPAAAPAAPGESEGYRAYKAVRDDEPSMFVDVIYYQLLPLALGIQMAGPDLTPDNFETGLLAYPEATGPAGTWDWRPGSYTPAVDARELWWDPDAPSGFDGLPGAYVDGGKRYRLGELPAGDPEVLR